MILWGLLVFILSALIGTIIFLILKLGSKLDKLGCLGNLTVWILCCFVGWLLLLFLGKSLRFVSIVVLLGLIVYVIITALKD
ncbi:hypothetical protein [Clostridium sp. N3C]|uniref:hypothetical protein n=1 Tax=Clostridium sp. N3C TaxID=1776758 RepID=UPI001177FDD3|nr:hypothetical protein [Clostridium sp. N3C]